MTTPVTLVHTDGREYTTDSPTEINDLLLAGYARKPTATPPRAATLTPPAPPAERPEPRAGK